MPLIAGWRQWGESDLSPLMRWALRYTAWLEDRARLNRYRNAFLYIVQAKVQFRSPAQTAPADPQFPIPPSPAPFWSSTTRDLEGHNPHLHSAEANEDGLALKKNDRLRGRHSPAFSSRARIFQRTHC